MPSRFMYRPIVPSTGARKPDRDRIELSETDSEERIPGNHFQRSEPDLRSRIVVGIDRAAVQKLPDKA